MTTTQVRKKPRTRGPIEGRFELHLISSEALAQYMRYRDLSVRDLADKVGCSHATIGHLRSGARSYASVKNAKAIEKALDAPAGSLFIAKVSRFAQETPRRKVAA